MDKLNETTYTQEVKDDPKDSITVEVGDSKQEDFKPQVKIMRWDNEVNFSMRAEEKEGATVEEKDGKIQYVTPEYEVHMYDKPDASEDGGFEFEWVLPKKPASNVLTATIQTKGLNFFYQPELTQEEIDRGDLRPENIIGSYAVYHQSKGGMNRADGMEYKTGKTFHIYRPKVKDANGNEVWGVLSIDEQSGLLTVTIEQAWLDGSAYPVMVDPTFGFTSIGASSVDRDIAAYGGLYTIAEQGDIASIALYGGQQNPAHLSQCNIYESDNDQVTNGVSNTRGGTIAETWVVYTYTTKPVLMPGDYYLASRAQNQSGSSPMYYDAAAGTGFSDVSSVVNTWDSPLADETDDTNRYSIYANYIPYNTISKNFYLKQGFQ